MRRAQHPSWLQSRSENAHGAPAQLVIDFIHGLPQLHLSLSISTGEERRLNLILTNQLVQKEASLGKFETIPPDPLTQLHRQAHDLLRVVGCLQELTRGGIRVPG